MAPRREQRINEAQAYFERNGYVISYEEIKNANVTEIPEEIQGSINSLKGYLKYGDNLTNQELDEVIAMVGNENNLDYLLDTLQKKKENDFSEYIDEYLDCGDKKDEITEQHKKLKKEVEDLKNNYINVAEGFKEFKFGIPVQKDIDERATEGTQMAQSYFSCQSWAFNTFGTPSNPKLNIAEFEGYKDALAHVLEWRGGNISKSKFDQKDAMASDMNTTNALIGPVIDLYRRGAEFAASKHEDSVEKAAENLNNYANTLKVLLRTFSVKLNETNKEELVTDKDSLGRARAFFIKRKEDLEGHLAIEKKKEKDSSSWIGTKKEEHAKNIKYIEQDIKILNYLCITLAQFPQMGYVMDDKGEFVHVDKYDRGGIDILTFQDDFLTYADKYKAEEQKIVDAHNEYQIKGLQLKNLETDELKPAEKATKEADEALRKEFDILHKEKKKSDAMKEAVRRRINEKRIAEERRKAEEARRRAEEEKERQRIADLEKKDKEEADRLKKQQEEELKKQQEEELKRQQEEAARANARKAEAPAEKMIDANIYRKELLRLTKELTSKTYRMGQSNTQGFTDLKNALSKLLDPKAKYDTVDNLPASEFTAQMENIEKACDKYAEDHKDGKLNDNQMLRLKIMSRMKNVLDMARNRIDPTSYEGRKRMLYEKFNNAECLAVLKSKTATEEQKQEVKDRLINYSNIGMAGITRAANNDKMKAFMEQFKVEDFKNDEEYLMNLSDGHKENEYKAKSEAMLNELKKPGTKFIKDILDPQKHAEKTSEKVL